MNMHNCIQLCLPIKPIIHVCCSLAILYIHEDSTPGHGVAIRPDEGGEVKLYDGQPRMNSGFSFSASI